MAVTSLAVWYLTKHTYFIFANTLYYVNSRTEAIISFWWTGNVSHVNTTLEPETRALMKWMEEEPSVLSIGLQGGALQATYPIYIKQPGKYMMVQMVGDMDNWLLFPHYQCKACVLVWCEEWGHYIPVYMHRQLTPSTLHHLLYFKGIASMLSLMWRHVAPWIWFQNIINSKGRWSKLSIRVFENETKLSHWTHCACMCCYNNCGYIKSITMEWNVLPLNSQSAL